MVLEMIPTSVIYSVSIFLRVCRVTEKQVCRARCQLLEGRLITHGLDRDTYRTFKINLFEWASARYEALSFRWGYRVWALGLIALGLPWSVQSPSKPGEELYLYLAVSPHTISSAFVKKERKTQKPIYYTSKALRMEK